MTALSQTIAALAATLVLIGGPVRAEPVVVGEIEVDTPWARASLGTSRPGAAYFTVRNLGSEPDRLIGLSSPVSAMPMLHETNISDNGISRMTHLEEVEIPGGGALVLEPGAMHVMLMDLTSALEEGATFPMTLTFERAGDVTVEVPVMNIGARGPEE